jgi:urease accessory protein
MNSHQTLRRLTLAALLIVPAIAQAHPGHGHSDGFAAGVMHLFSGADHIAGLVIAGLLLGRLSASLRWFAFAGFLVLVGATHALWVAPTLASGEFVIGLVLTSAFLVTAGMAATRYRITAASRR